MHRQVIRNVLTRWEVCLQPDSRHFDHNLRFKAIIIDVIESITSRNTCSLLLLAGRTTRSFSAAELGVSGNYRRAYGDMAESCDEILVLCRRIPITALLETDNSSFHSTLNFNFIYIHLVFLLPQYMYRHNITNNNSSTQNGAVSHTENIVPLRICYKGVYNRIQSYAVYARNLRNLNSEREVYIFHLVLHILHTVRMSWNSTKRLQKR